MIVVSCGSVWFEAQTADADDPGIVGLAKQSDYITDLSFDILSLEALFLVPRYGLTVSL